MASWATRQALGAQAATPLPVARTHDAARRAGTARPLLGDNPLVVYPGTFENLRHSLTASRPPWRPTRHSPPAWPTYVRRFIRAQRRSVLTSEFLRLLLAELPLRFRILSGKLLSPRLDKRLTCPGMGFKGFLDADEGNCPGGYAGNGAQSDLDPARQVFPGHGPAYNCQALTLKGFRPCLDRDPTSQTRACVGGSDPNGRRWRR
jgi:hypothetical protein